MNRSQIKDETFLAMAHLLGQLGTCDRKKVGCIITLQGRCISWGYNGAPPDSPHCDENHHGWHGASDPGVRFEPQMVPYYDKGELLPKKMLWEVASRQFGCSNAIHAEANAVAFAARQGISTENGTCYIGVSPCATCARLLVAAGIVRVVYTEEYRDTAGLNILMGAGVIVG